MKVPPKILIVEDDEDDLFLAERVLARAGMTDIHHAGNGRLAIDYLAGNGDFARRELHPMPDVVLIDLKLPEINGHQVAEWIAAQANLQSLRCYILSSSGEDRDRTRAAQARAAGYFVKPLLPENVQEILSAMPEVG